MHGHTFSKVENHQIRHQATGCQSGDCIYASLIFLRGLCGYVWVNILTMDNAGLMYITQECELGVVDYIMIYTQTLMS